MKVLADFLDSCFELPVGNAFGFFIENYTDLLSSVRVEDNKQFLVDYIRKAKDNDRILTIASGITKCREFCEEKVKNVSSAKKDTKLQHFCSMLQRLSYLIESTLNEQEAGADDVHQDMANISVVLDSYRKKIVELKEEMQTLSRDVHEQSNIFDSKVFQLLINTVSVLGIFVAVAFAGFGGTTILSSVNINLSTDLLRGVFSLCLISFLIYNMIFLLIYFIFVILRNFYTNQKMVPYRFISPKTSIVFKPLLAIDLVLLIVTVILFYYVVKFTGIK